MAFHFTCPFCSRDATITSESVSSDTAFLYKESAEGKRALHVRFVVCPSPKCRKFTLTASLHQVLFDGHQHSVGAMLRAWELIPSSSAQSFPPYVPAPILADYHEACLIRDLSPKASATLSRRALQGIIRDFWQVKSGRLVDEIAAIKDKVDPLTWAAIDAVRKVGNIGAHMESDINVIVDVESNEAELLIGLIESLLKDWYVTREERKAHLAALVQMSAEKDKDRKAKPVAP
jgi:hypothetical protein